MIRRLRRLWRGDLPLAEAIWVWGILVALPLNALATLAFLWLMTLDRPWAALVIGTAPAVPYNIVCAVGIWRAARQIADPTRRAILRAITVVAAGILCLI
ncbi:MAG: hypothetical protein IT556_16090 [Acetobacteraceae bacterium]|nr:hypothetical protein [Acetobacteraceae bacterium]